MAVKQNNKQSLASLAMDLKRAALGWHSNSDAVARRFYGEALKRKSEIDKTSLQKYLKDIIFNLDSDFETNDSNTKAEKALMFSTLIQNFVVYKL